MVISITNVPAFAGGIELVLVFALFILLFGASKIPKLARSMGRSINEFERGRQEDPDPENND